MTTKPRIDWSKISDEQLLDGTGYEVAARIGCSHESVYMQRRLRGLAGPKARKKAFQRFAVFAAATEIRNGYAVRFTGLRAEQ